jgi:hypothetical protein
MEDRGDDIIQEGQKKITTQAGMAREPIMQSIRRYQSPPEIVICPNVFLSKAYLNKMCPGPSFLNYSDSF